MSFSRVCISGKRSDPDKVYYNANVINSTGDLTLNKENPQLTFGDNRQNSLISDSADYRLSVQEFTINGGGKTLPLFIPEILDPNSDVNTTIYEVTVAVANTTLGNQLYTQRIIWIPENQSQFAPVPELSPVQIESEYYYLYSYSHWVKLVNNAIQTAYSNIPGTFGTKCPFIQYDSNSGLFSIYQDANTCLVPYGGTLEQPFGSVSTAGGSYQDGEYTFVGMNTNLENLLSNFPEIYFGTNKTWEGDGVTPLPEYVIDMGLTNLDIGGVGTQALGVGLRQVNSYPLVNPFTVSPITGTSFIQLTQDYNSTGSIWSPIASIVIQTTQIPVRNEFVANPFLSTQENIGIENAASGAFQKVLIETPINAVTAELWRGWILYQPLIPTYSSLDPTHQGLSDIDFQVFWRNRITNSLVPLRTVNNGSMSIRLLFEKK